MTVKEAAKNWGLSASTVSSYCRKGVAFGPRIFAKKEKNNWTIPDDSARPYLPSIKRPAEAIKCYRHILIAIEREQYLSASTLGISEKRYHKYFDEIVATHYVNPVEDGAAYHTGKYYLTIDGVQWKKETYPSRAKQAKNALDVYIEMVIKAIADAAID